MATRVKDFGMTSDPGNISNYSRTPEVHLTALTRALGVCTAIVVCGVGADVAYRGHVMGVYVTASSAVILFLEVTWAVTLFVQVCVRNDDSLCWRCWSSVLVVTRGWRRALFYLPLSCILAWKSHRLWLSFVAAGMLVVLSLLHIGINALGRRGCHQPGGVDSVVDSLLNTRPETYDRFEEVLIYDLHDGPKSPTAKISSAVKTMNCILNTLVAVRYPAANVIESMQVTEVLDDGVSGPAGRLPDSDGEI